MKESKYILDGHVPVACFNVLEWGRWFEHANRHVASTKIGDVRVSTVFLGIDHSFKSEGPLVLFETMIFGGPLDQNEQRYSTWEEAERGHEEMVKRAKEAK